MTSISVVCGQSGSDPRPWGTTNLRYKISSPLSANSSATPVANGGKYEDGLSARSLQNGALDVLTLIDHAGPPTRCETASGRLSWCEKSSVAQLQPHFTLISAGLTLK